MTDLQVKSAEAGVRFHRAVKLKLSKKGET